MFKKQEHRDPEDPADDQCGDWWDHTAHDPEHKLVLGVIPGARGVEEAEAAVTEVKDRTGGRPKDWRVQESMTNFRMYIYKFYWPVRTLESRAEEGQVRHRSPAMAARLADHVWTMREWVTMPSVQGAEDTTAG